MKKAKLIIDMPNGCEDCPLRAMFFDSDWNIQRGIKHYSCRLRLDRCNVAGTGRPDYCPLVETKERTSDDEEVIEVLNQLKGE